MATITVHFVDILCVDLNILCGDVYGSDEKHVYVLMCLSFEKRHCVRVI